MVSLCGRARGERKRRAHPYTARTHPYTARTHVPFPAAASKTIAGRVGIPMGRGDRGERCRPVGQTQRCDLASARERATPQPRPLVVVVIGGGLPRHTTACTVPLRRRRRRIVSQCAHTLFSTRFFSLSVPLSLFLPRTTRFTRVRTPRGPIENA